MTCSSDPSLQSISPSQRQCSGTHLLSPQLNLDSGGHVTFNAINRKTVHQRPAAELLSSSQRWRRKKSETKRKQKSRRRKQATTNKRSLGSTEWRGFDSARACNYWRNLIGMEKWIDRAVDRPEDSGRLRRSRPCSRPPCRTPSASARTVRCGTWTRRPCMSRLKWPSKRSASPVGKLFTYRRSQTAPAKKE